MQIQKLNVIQDLKKAVISMNKEKAIRPKKSMKKASKICKNVKTNGKQ